MKSVSALTVSASGVVHVAEQNALKIISFHHYLPSDDENGDYKVSPEGGSHRNINTYNIFLSFLVGCLSKN